MSMIEVRGVGQRVDGGRRTLRDVSLTIASGELVAIIGGSGAGKTTLLDAIAGVRPPAEGEVRHGGAGGALGYVPQDDIVHTEMPLRRTLRYAAGMRLPAGTSPEAAERAVDEVLEALALTAHAGQRVGALSGGERKRASIAVELLTRPGVFYLDEPTSGLDPATAADLMRLLRGLADAGTTVIVTTHHPPDVAVCDRVAVLAPDGRLAFYGSPDEAKQEFQADGIEGIYLRLAGAGEPREWAGRFDAPGHVGGQGIGAFAQWALLTRRNVDLLTRNRLTLAILVGSPLMVLAMFAVLFRPGAFSPASPSPAAGVMILFWIAFGGFFFGLTYGLLQICTELPVLRRERFTGRRRTAPRDTAPRDTAPRDTAPRDTAPRDTAPRDTGPVAPPPVQHSIPALPSEPALRTAPLPSKNGDRPKVAPPANRHPRSTLAPEAGRRSEAGRSAEADQRAEGGTRTECYQNSEHSQGAQSSNNTEADHAAETDQQQETDQRAEAGRRTKGDQGADGGKEFDDGREAKGAQGVQGADGGQGPGAGRKAGRSKAAKGGRKPRRGGRAEGGLRIPAYVLAKVAVLLPLLAAVDGLMLGVLRALDRLPAMGWRTFGELFVTLLLCSLAALAVGLLVSAAVTDPAQATMALPMLCFPQVLFVGAILPVPVMAAPGRWLSYAMSNRWAFEALGHSLGVERLWGSGRSPLGPPLLASYGDTFSRSVIVDWALLAGFAALFLAATGLVLSRRAPNAQ